VRKCIDGTQAIPEATDPTMRGIAEGLTTKPLYVALGVLTAQRTHGANRFDELRNRPHEGSLSMPWRYSATMAGKYGRLCEHLRALQETEWRAGFAEIEEVLGLDLPGV